MDDKGNLWVTAKGLSVYNPEGKRVHFLELTDVILELARSATPTMKTLFLTARGLVFRARPEAK